MAVIKSGSSVNQLDITSNNSALVTMIDQNGNFISTIEGAVLTDNSSNAALNSGATFTGAAHEAINYSSIILAALTDKDGTMYAEFSTDGTNWDGSIPFSVSANINEVHRVTVTRRYFRVRFTNTSAAAQTFMRLQCLGGAQPQLTSTLNSTVQQDADALIVRNIDSQIDIAAGKYTGYSIVNKAGYNPDVDIATVPEDIWEAGGTYTGFPLTSGETITVVSTSANDTSAGTGARTMRITGLDANYDIQTEDFTLNGTTPVTGVKTFVRVHTATVLTSGSSNTAFNIGTISVYHTTTTANVFLSMRVGANQTNCSAYTVPAGYNAYVRQISCKVGASSTATTSAVDYAIWTQSALKTNSPRLRRPNTTYWADGAPDDIYGGLIFTEKTDLVLRVTTCVVNNTPVVGVYDILLVKN